MLDLLASGDVERTTAAVHLHLRLSADQRPAGATAAPARPAGSPRGRSGQATGAPGSQRRRPSAGEASR
jgi:hypothetical protein